VADLLARTVVVFHRHPCSSCVHTASQAEVASVDRAG
jgi:hypothetical protein